MLTKFERVFQGRRKMYCEKSENQIKARLSGKMSPQNDGGCSGEAAPSHIISSPKPGPSPFGILDDFRIQIILKIKIY